MPYVYRVTDRGGSWPMLSREPRSAPPDSPLRVELVAETEDEAAAWRAWAELVVQLRDLGALM